MGFPHEFQPHKLFVAALFNNRHSFEEVSSIIAARFGPVDAFLEPHPFTFSSYYAPEMGDELTRSIVSIGPLADPSDLATFKKQSNAIEVETGIKADVGQQADARASIVRTLNLDPGLLSLSRVMLATTKPSAHRIPLRDGMHAEITLLYRSGRYAPLEWTYPDFQSKRFVDWLGTVRVRYHAQLREIDPDRPWRL